VSECVCCGRHLTNHKSMDRGLGPVCQHKASMSDSGTLFGDAPVLVGVPPMKEVGLLCRRLHNGHAATNVPQVLRQHIADGFEWGDGSEETKSLALNVMHQLVPGMAWDLHEEFRAKFLENIPKEGTFVPIEGINEWLIRRLTAHQ